VACQIYATPVGDTEVCVALISNSPQLRLDQALPRFPELYERLRGTEASSAERGAVTASRQLKRVCTDRLALAGDASGSIDAITGEGMCLTFHHAAALARCLEAGSLEGYEKEHRRLRRRPALMANMLLTMGQRKWLRRRALRALSERQSVFSGFLAMHVGALPAHLFATNVLALGWGMIVSA
jgi:2-polyprenyl-6-methoxyphenol hydroxylase-like FAD-dependent oxidoreductase